jgi:uncharacterized membrane protein
MSYIPEIIHEIHFFSFLLGSILVLTGFITRKFPPKKINMFYGYRTGSSMKNQQNWDYAQKYAVREMLRGGWIMVAFSLTGIIYSTSTLVETISGSILMTVIFIALFIRTERSLRHFDNKDAEN